MLKVHSSSPLIGEGVLGLSCVLQGRGWEGNTMFLSCSRLISVLGVPGVWRQEPGLSSAPPSPQRPF